MTRDTSDLIRRLAADGTPAEPLPAPSTRTGLWVAVSVPYLIVLYALWPHPAVGAAIDDRFLIEQLAALVTALTAGLAAFATVVPGSSRAVALVPLAPVTVWVGTLGYGCARDGSIDISRVLLHWGCFPVTLVAGLVPTIAMVVMLRRGAPLTPCLTTALGGLAVAALANVAIRFVHAFDASLIVLTWHVLAVFVLSAIVSTRGARLFKWPHLLVVDGVGH